MQEQYLKHFHLVEGKCLGQSKSPPSFEGPPDHGTAGGGGGAGQTVGVGELESTHLHTDIHLINWGEELGQRRLGWNWNAMQCLKKISYINWYVLNSFMKIETQCNPAQK